MVRDTPRTASRLPRAKLTRRSSTVSLSLAGIDASDVIREGVAYEADEEAEGDDGQPGEHYRPGRRQHQVAALGDHQSPFRRRRLHTQAEEAERGTELDVEYEIAHTEDESGGDRVGQDVPEHDAEVAKAETPRRQDEGARLESERLPADDAGVQNPAHQCHSNVEVDQARP